MFHVATEKVLLEEYGMPLRYRVMHQQQLEESLYDGVIYQEDYADSRDDEIEESDIDDDDGSDRMEDVPVQNELTNYRNHVGISCYFVLHPSSVQYP